MAIEKQRALMSRIVPPPRDGRLTIPSDMRRELGISRETPLRLTVEDGELRVRPVGRSTEPGGTPWLRDVYDAFSGVRDALAPYTDDEIDAAIDDAVRAVRRRHD